MQTEHELGKTALEIAREDVERENPNLPILLRFEVSERMVVDQLLGITDLTLPTPEGQVRNIIGLIFDSVVKKLSEYKFKNISVVRGEAVVKAKDNFDALLFPPGNPGRSSTYTRYVDKNHVLRTHTSAIFPGLFLAIDPSTIDQTTYIAPGLVYRRDVIDPKHLDAFHQIDVWTLQDNEKHGKTTKKDLLNLVKAIFEAACPTAEMIVYDAKHPYTLEGIEVYAKIEGQEIEVLEAGLIHPDVLRNAGIDPEKYSGLASGMGVERLIMARKKLPDIRLIRSKDPRIQAQMNNLESFKSVSNQPAMVRDMSYCVDKNDSEEDICEEIRLAFEEKDSLLEEVKILQRTKYTELPSVARERLGAKENQDNVLVRITLRHPDMTLTKEEAVTLYDDVYPKLHKGTKGYEVK